MNETVRQQFPLRSLIKATGGRPFFIKRTKLSREAAEKYLADSKSPQAPLLLASINAAAAAPVVRPRRCEKQV